MSLRKLLSIVLVLASVGALAGCVPAPTPTPSTQEKATAVAGVATAVQMASETIPLVGTAWQLESFGGPEDNLPGLPNVRPTVNFLVTRYGGHGGCNWYMGVFEVGETSIRLNTPATTQTLCADPGLLEQEGTFMSALTNLLEYELQGEKLLGYTSNRQHLLTLVPADPVALEGTTWQLAFIHDGKFWQPLILDTTITAQFDGDQLSGSAGCNEYSAAIDRGPNTLTVSDATTGLAACDAPKGIMDQEQRFHEALSSVTGYVHAGSTLVMTSADDQPVLSFGARFEEE